MDIGVLFIKHDEILFQRVEKEKHEANAEHSSRMGS
jgi:hypothetical protein